MAVRATSSGRDGGRRVLSNGMPALKSLAPFFLGLLLEAVETKGFSKCNLANIMTAEALDGYRGYALGNWVCVAFHASYYNSMKIGRQQQDSGRSYGIFQLSNMEHCSDGCRSSLNLCRVDCTNFLDDDLRDDIRCAKKAASTGMGMGAWNVWKLNCQGRNLITWTPRCRIRAPWQKWG